jgi:hypothetical protein
MKRKTCNIRNWTKYLFLDISSTNIDTLAPSLYQCVETRRIEVFRLLYQPLPHLLFNVFVISETSATNHARLLPRLSKSWTVLLPSDTYRTPITSITAVLLPSVTYLLTLLRGRGVTDVSNEKVGLAPAEVALAPLMTLAAEAMFLIKKCMRVTLAERALVPVTKTMRLAPL